MIAPCKQLPRKKVPQCAWFIQKCSCYGARLVSGQVIQSIGACPFIFFTEVCCKESSLEISLKSLVGAVQRLSSQLWSSVVGGSGKYSFDNPLPEALFLFQDFRYSH